MSLIGLGVLGWILATPAIAADVTPSGLLKSHERPHDATPGQLSADDQSHTSIDGFTPASPTLLSTVLTPSLAPTGGIHPLISITVEANMLLLGGDPTADGNPLGPPASLGLSLPRVPEASSLGSEICPRLSKSLMPPPAWSPAAAYGLATTPPVEPGVTAQSIGGPTQLSSAGPISHWCQPAAVPFDESSPLTSRSLWLPLIILALAGGVLIVTRRKTAITHPNGRAA